MRADLQANFVGQNGELACQQRADTKRSAGVCDAGFPIPSVEPKLFERIGYLKFEIRHPRFSFFPIPRNQRSNQIDLAWEMVMDGGIGIRACTMKNVPASADCPPLRIIAHCAP